MDKEEYIQYLYKVIEKLESQNSINIKKLQDTSNQLRYSKKLCNEKKKFILF